jgi:hypothetical protein
MTGTLFVGAVHKHVASEFPELSKRQAEVPSGRVDGMALIGYSTERTSPPSTRIVVPVM